jgi:hypothetical protein
LRERQTKGKRASEMTEKKKNAEEGDQEDDDEK